MVIVTFRTVQNKVYRKELLPEATIGDVKELFAQQHCECQAENIKMLFKAKTLQNDIKIGSLNLGPKDFIIVNTPKPSSQSKPQPVPQPLAEVKPLSIAEPLPTAQSLSQNQSNAIGNMQGTIPSAGGSNSANVVESPEFQQNVNTLMELGFAKEDCEAALRASHGNCERAAEYLLTGNIPDPEENEIDPNVILSIRILIASLLIEPRFLENLVEKMEQEDPAIRQNPELILERFGNLPQDRFDLNGIKNHTIQPLSPAEYQQVQIQAAQAVGLIPGAGTPAQGSQSESQMQSQNRAPERRTASQETEAMLAALPQKDQDAIHRLQQLGNFPLLEVIQIYQACEKNENQAANILFNSL